jgi:ketosteroid isomerase-like protein
VSRAAAEVVRSFYAAYEAGDIATRQNLLGPGFEFIALDGTLVHGRQGLLRALDDMAEQFRSYDVHASEFVTVDEATVVVALTRSALTHRGDVPVTDRFAQLFELGDGLIVRVQSFRTVDEALASVNAARAGSPRRGEPRRHA